LLASARVPGKIDDNPLLWQNYEGIYSSGRDRKKGTFKTGGIITVPDKLGTEADKFLH
jgi:hypothetical protein